MALQCSFFSHQIKEGEMDDAILKIDARMALRIENIW
jgi:hypothetical protein